MSIAKFFIGGKLPVLMTGKEYYRTMMEKVEGVTEDAEFEVIPPLMISDKNDDECDATKVDSINEAGKQK